MKKKRKAPKRKTTRNAHLKIFIALSTLFVVFSSTLLLANKNQSSHIASENTIQLGSFVPSVAPTTIPTQPIYVPTPTPTLRPIVVPPTETPTPTPTTSPYCTDLQELDPAVDTCQCMPGAKRMWQCRNERTKWGYGTCATTHQCGAGPCLEDCFAKPVIYLYPLQPTYVDVNVITTGSITVSDPTYPTGGWKHVLAQPDGNLTYNGGTYSELFYESETPNYKRPINGATLKSSDIEISLPKLLDHLGLVGSEQQEFLDYWVPKLKDLKAPYIQFSLIDPIEKEKIDHVDISPTPNTFIEFLVYFKPLSKPYEGPLLELPSKPERKGFTAVEWGGTIDSK